MKDEATARELQLAAEAEANVHKINESNIGFQLLKKSGWTEGTGLVVPIPKVMFRLESFIDSRF